MTAGKSERRDGHPPPFDGKVGAEQSRSQVVLGADDNVLDRCGRGMRGRVAFQDFRSERGQSVYPGQEQNLELPGAEERTKTVRRETMGKIPVISSPQAGRTADAQRQRAAGGEHSGELVERPFAIRQRHVLQNVGAMKRRETFGTERQRGGGCRT